MSKEQAYDFDEINQIYWEDCNSKLAHAKEQVEKILAKPAPLSSVDEFLLPGYQRDWKHYETLLAFYKITVDNNMNISFGGFFNTMEQYPQRVIYPMMKLIAEGKLEEALALYKQDRHYHR